MHATACQGLTFLICSIRFQQFLKQKSTDFENEEIVLYFDFFSCINQTVIESLKKTFIATHKNEII